jgi:CheY-like chemotaxis protein
MAARKVLAVEDEEVARRLLARYLEQIPHIVFTIVSDGPTALQKLQEEAWDIVLLDIEMAEIDGLYLMNYIETLTERPAIIFTTAYSEHAVNAFAGGAVDYLLKPFSLERLRQAFERAERYLRAQSAPKPLTDKITLPTHDRYLVLSPHQLVAAFLENDQLFHRNPRRHASPDSHPHPERPGNQTGYPALPANLPPDAPQPRRHPGNHPVVFRPL